MMRFFKKGTKKAPVKKATKAAPKENPPKVTGAKMKPAKKILTAEGWRRLMMKKGKVSKK